MTERLIAIGSTAAGLSAASRARKEEPDTEIQISEKSGFVSYEACGLPHFVGGSIHGINELMAINAESLRSKRDISAWIHHEVALTNLKKKEVSIKNLDTDRVSTHPYDKLVIATGTIPVVPPISEIHSNGVYYLRNMEDGIRLKAVAREDGRVCITNGGAIRSETTEELSKVGLSVFLYEQFPQPFPFLDNAFSKALEDVLTKRGIKVHTGAQISEIFCENGKTKGVRTVYGKNKPSDTTLVSTGIKPVSTLAEKAGLALGLNGGVIVDDEIHAGHEGIWAYGNCVQMKNRTTGEPAYVPLGTAANKQGRIASGNVAGEHDTFKGVSGSMATEVLELFTAAIGLSQEQAVREGSSTMSISITKADRTSCHPDGRGNHVRLIVDKKASLLLDAQDIRSESIARRINILATVTTCGITVGEINELDLVYSPPAAPAYGPILAVASRTMKKVTE